MKKETVEVVCGSDGKWRVIIWLGIPLEYKTFAEAYRSAKARAGWWREM